MCQLLYAINRAVDKNSWMFVFRERRTIETLCEKRRSMIVHPSIVAICIIVCEIIPSRRGDYLYLPLLFLYDSFFLSFQTGRCMLYVLLDLCHRPISHKIKKRIQVKHDSLVFVDSLKNFVKFRISIIHPGYWLVNMREGAHQRTTLLYLLLICIPFIHLFEIPGRIGFNSMKYHLRDDKHTQTFFSTKSRRFQMRMRGNLRETLRIRINERLTMFSSHRYSYCVVEIPRSWISKTRRKILVN